MRSTLIFFLLAGCGTFPLGTSTALQGQTQQQLQQDILWCKDQAHTAANTPGRQAAYFAAGLTIIGAPAAYENEKALQREVYAKCMTDKGYRVELPK